MRILIHDRSYTSCYKQIHPFNAFITLHCLCCCEECGVWVIR